LRPELDERDGKNKHQYVCDEGEITQATRRSTFPITPAPATGPANEPTPPTMTATNP